MYAIKHLLAQSECFPYEIRQRLANIRIRALHNKYKQIVGWHPMCFSALRLHDTEKATPEFGNRSADDNTMKLILNGTARSCTFILHFPPPLDSYLA